MLLHLPSVPNQGETPRVKNGLPLAGHGAEAVRNVIVVTNMTSPGQSRPSLAWDQDAETASNVSLAIRQQHLTDAPRDYVWTWMVEERGMYEPTMRRGKSFYRISRHIFHPSVRVTARPGEC